MLRVRARIFEKITVTGTGLARTKEFLEPGTMIELGGEETCTFHYQNHIAFPFKHKGKTFYLLQAELDSEYNQCAERPSSIALGRPN